MRNVLSMLVIVCVVMALPLGLLAWEEGELRPTTAGGETISATDGHPTGDLRANVGCPMMLYGQMNGIYYYYVHNCATCTYVGASTTRLHQLGGSCNCPSGPENCDELVLSSHAKSALLNGSEHVFEDEDRQISFAKKKPGKKAKPNPSGTDAADPAFFYRASPSILVDYDRDRIVFLQAGGETYYFRVLDVTTDIGDRPMFIGQEIDTPDPIPDDEATFVESHGDFSYTIEEGGNTYAVRTRHVITPDP